ncbi:MAG: hypothetical protein NTY02_19080 [Acidobacteria bacterium]|nr:hypothetical protein [Acidobacteriota bacterium]
MLALGVVPRRASLQTAVLGALMTAFLAWLLFAGNARGVAVDWAVGLAVLAAGSCLTWRRWFGHVAWRQFATDSADVHVLLAGLLLVLAAPHAFHWEITSDGGLYFANLRSLVFDHDLRIRPELEFLGLADRPHSIVPVGPAIIWAPLYLVVAGLDWLTGFSGRPAGVAHGLEGPYVRAALVSSWLIASAGVVAIHWRLRREFGRVTAALTSLLIVGASPLVYYMVVERSMTHAASFGVVALALTASDVWFRGRVPRSPEAFGMGALIGLAILVRPQDGLFGIFPVVALCFTVRGSAGSAPWLKLLLWMAAGAMPFVAAQGVVAWFVMAVNQVPYQLVGGGGYLQFASSRWLDVLFSSRHGLLSWTPIVSVALVGTVAYLRRDAAWALSTLLVFVAMCWINGSATDWAGGSAFGGRRFTSMMGPLAPGLAVVVFAVLRRPVLVLAPVAGGIIFWNYLLMMQFEHGMMTRDEAIGFGRLVRQQAEEYTRPPYFYPFAFPANAWFALREGLPIDAYDVLGVEPLRTALDITFNERGDRFLIEGWRDDGDDEFGPRRFLDGEAALMAVPLDVPADRPYAVSIRARAGRGAPNEPPVVITVGVNGRPFGLLTLTPAADPSVTTFTAPADAGHRLWRKGINRLTFRRVASAGRPAARGAGPAVVVYNVRLGSNP